ncbi:MAG: YfhO family protein [Ruminococcus sp.]|nr:YfhO family protein [Ruminococcus sp.]
MMNTTLTNKASRRLGRKDYIVLLVLAAAVAAAAVGFTHFKYAFGAELDWADQHFAIPDYFRKLFYETGELFPSLAANIGGGENIYYLSFYGLYSPVILFSYLLPFVSMVTYIQISSVFMCWLGTALFYRFMRKRHGMLRSVILTAAYLTASPVFFHAHRHIMFVNYLPFLILALEAVDDYFEGRRRWTLPLWVLMMILTSWFYSPAAIAAVTVYGVYRYLSLSERFDIKDFGRAAVCYAGRIMTAVLAAGILLLPTLKVVLSGRDKSNSGISLKDLLPTVSTEAIGYSPYSMGLGAFALLAVICAVTVKKDKARRFMGIVFAAISCLPVIAYILNGTMYIEYKVFIPFIPLALVLCGELLTELDTQPLRMLNTVIYTAFIALSTLFGVMHVSENYVSIAKLGMLIDSGVLLICLSLHRFKGWKAPVSAALIAMPLAVFVPLNAVEEFVPLEKLAYRTSPALETLSKKAYDSGSSLWRSSIGEQRVDTVNIIPDVSFYGSYIYSSLHHKGYNDFYFKVMHNENEFRNSALTTRSQNPFFTAFMGERWLISNKTEAPFGYVQAAAEGELYLYESKNVLPIGRTAPTLGEDVFEQLGSAEQMEALCNYIVTGSGGEYKGSVIDIGIIDLPENSCITKTEEGWRVTSDKKLTLSCPLGRAVPEGKLLVLEMTCDNTVGEPADARVTINGVRNTLTAPDWKYYNNNTTFTYVIPACEQLDFIFTKGDYLLSDLRAWTVDAPAFSGAALEIDKSATKGDRISGSITCPEDSFFELAVPYDEGFTVTVDGVKQEYQCVDKAFIGFPISKGEHSIEFSYKAPLLNAGKLSSLTGALIFAVMTALEVIGKKKKAAVTAAHHE